MALGEFDHEGGDEPILCDIDACKRDADAYFEGVWLCRHHLAEAAKSDPIIKEYLETKAIE